jgi:hypothetical protein
MVFLFHTDSAEQSHPCIQWACAGAEPNHNAPLIYQPLRDCLPQRCFEKSGELCGCIHFIDSGFSHAPRFQLDLIEATPA